MEIFNRKNKIFSREKRKSPENLMRKVFGNRLFVYDGNCFHSLRLERLVGPVGCNARDAVENVEAFGQLTERGVRAVKMRCVLERNIKLC